MTVKVGAVQAEPVWLDLQGGVEKTISYIKKAAANGVNVLGFPEVFIPGYPWSIWTTSVLENVDYIDQYMNNSLVKDSPEMDRIREAVREAGMFVVLGYSERHKGSLYISQSFISPEGKIVLHRRKIKPTHVERSIYGDGQAESLTNVVDSLFGRIGGLNCWEHSQPLLRYYEYSQGSQIHVASWPSLFDDNPPMPWSISNKAELVMSQNMAMEGACFVLVASQTLSEANHKVNNTAGVPYFESLDSAKGGPRASGGFSMIFAPDGKPLCEPLEKGEEGIVTAVVDLKQIDFAKHLLDVVGHYSRPDLLSVLVEPNEATQVTFRK